MLSYWPRAADATSGAARLPLSRVTTMKKNRDRERVIAEITLFHLIRLGNEHGCTVSREQATAFLNEEERAQADVESYDAGWSGLHRVQLISAVRQPGVVSKDARIHAVCPRCLYPELRSGRSVRSRFHPFDTVTIYKSPPFTWRDVLPRFGQCPCPVVGARPPSDRCSRRSRIFTDF